LWVLLNREKQMKTLLSLLLVFFSYTIISFSQESDSTLSEKPESMPEREFEFPEFQKITLDNGLKVFLIEDHEQPTITLRLLVGGGNSVDGNKAGLSIMASELIKKGTKKLDALSLVKKIDGVGGRLTANSNDDFVTVKISGLTKHLDLFMDVCSQMIISPTFPNTEIEKLKPRFLAKIKQEKENPRKIADALSKKVIYGDNHPYSSEPDENSIKSIKQKDIINYYNKYFVPDNSSLAVIGDFNKDEIIEKIKEYFLEWDKSSENLNIEVPEGKPKPLGVYFVERPGSVQSTIMFATNTVACNNRDYDLLTVATSVISGGISGRLFKTLREKYSYTYAPFGNMTKSKFNGRYFCGADVKKEVTDSAITIMLEQIRALCSQTPNTEEVSLVKTYLSGSYKMSFENSDHIAALIQNTDFYGKPINEVESYAQRIIGYSPYTIRNIANKYLKPEEVYIIVVGSPEIKNKLASFGKIYDFDQNLIPLSGENAKLENTGYDAEKLLEKYIEALGGKENLDSIHTVIDSAKVEMNSQGNLMEGDLIYYQKAPDKKYSIFDMNVFKQYMWVDGKDVWIRLSNIQKMESKEAEKLKYDAVLFKDAKLLEYNYQCKVLGKQGNMILMKAVSPAGFESVYYFNDDTFLIEKIERNEETTEGVIPITEYFKGYVEVNRVLFPKVIETVSPLYKIKTVNSYTINQPLDDTLFRPE
jgi:zinc protease